MYCEETGGYIFNFQSSCAYNGLYIYYGQDRKKPQNIQDPKGITFQVCIQNRYKLNKQYRKLLDAIKDDPNNLELRALLPQAEAASNAEHSDNIAEQRRLQGKKVRYGDIVQLRHMYTHKFVHVSTTSTSTRDKNNMKIELQTFNAKHAQFRIQPRYKVKSEGEYVQVYDQVVFESVKSSGHFFHASYPYFISDILYG